MFDKAIKNLDGIKLESEIDIVVKKNKNDILNFNRKNLSESELSTGRKITPVYADSNKKTGNPNLLLKGDFYQNQTLKVKQGVLAFFNNDPNTKKVASLEKWYGENIYGLQKQDVNVIEDDVARRMSLLTGNSFL